MSVLREASAWWHPAQAQVFLLDYEQAHPEDITGDSCAICGGGEDVADDWISCDVRFDLTSGLVCPAVVGQLAVHTLCHRRQKYVANYAPREQVVAVLS